jgi:hypothetical protein
VDDAHELVQVSRRGVDQRRVLTRRRHRPRLGVEGTDSLVISDDQPFLV